MFVMIAQTVLNIYSGCYIMADLKPSNKIQQIFAKIVKIKSIEPHYQK